MNIFRHLYFGMSLVAVLNCSSGNKEKAQQIGVTEKTQEIGITEENRLQLRLVHPIEPLREEEVHRLPPQENPHFLNSYVPKWGDQEVYGGGVLYVFSKDEGIFHCKLDETYLLRDGTRRKSPTSEEPTYFVLGEIHKKSDLSEQYQIFFDEDFAKFNIFYEKEIKPNGVRYDVSCTERCIEETCTEEGSPQNFNASLEVELRYP